MNRQDISKAIHAKVLGIAGSAARGVSLGMDDSIPESGLLDSPALMDLIFWYEAEFDLSIPQEDLTVENFGTVNAMADYVLRARGAAA
jgi:acyl carrier protein